MLRDKYSQTLRAGAVPGHSCGLLKRPGCNDSSSHSSSRLKQPVRLRMCQLADTEYPVNFPVHELPKDMPVDADQRAMIPDPKNILKRKYATSVDERNFLTVFEYSIDGGHTILWDYFTGHVHLAGIWKATGNSKADIARLVENSPELEPVLRRVRGGFLKIQGTWVPYDVARELARRVCYYIRFALVPLFGDSFPRECLSPSDPGFGQLLLKDEADVKAEGGTTRAGSRKYKGVRRKSIAPSPVHLHRERRREREHTSSLSRIMTSPANGENAADAGNDLSLSNGEDVHTTLGAKRLELPQTLTAKETPEELLKLLQATRTLQQLASGVHQYEPREVDVFARADRNLRKGSSSSGGGIGSRSSLPSFKPYRMSNIAFPDTLQRNHIPPIHLRPLPQISSFLDQS